MQSILTCIFLAWHIFWHSVRYRAFISHLTLAGWHADISSVPRVRTWWHSVARSPGPAPALPRMWRKLRSARWYETKQSIGCDTGDTLPCCDDATSDKQGQQSTNIVLIIPYFRVDIPHYYKALCIMRPRIAILASTNFDILLCLAARQGLGVINLRPGMLMSPLPRLSSHWSIIICSAISLAEHIPHKDAEVLSTCPM